MLGLDREIAHFQGTYPRAEECVPRVHWRLHDRVAATIERHIRDHGHASRFLALPSSRQYSGLIELLVNHDNRSQEKASQQSTDTNPPAQIRVAAPRGGTIKNEISYRLRQLLFSFELEDASGQAECFRFWRLSIVFWWVLIPIAASVPFLLYGLFRWASADPGIDAEIAKERYRAEQDWRGLHRSGSDSKAAKTVKN